ncbi:asparagine synthase (glutamine-hydrolyzing) [Sorangium cellulosum]|uniref:asparagine synthase (glutamine-hydrolyzing) n=1 Tax=Sorangium cellulosum TaxID=56 RepID=A0A150QB57_SORCE|nr:asparagine synthase (glutamine-hydrolyzing) [Sorangium cellulosum]KYF65153.1 asparagine synthetase B [Sorangium cellulosum]
MCSIAGIFNKKRPIGAAQHDEMASLLEAMHHRGPDARGAVQCASWALLGSNRLRITDAGNPGADMPLTSADQRLTLVFNGEIYNHRDLRARLSRFPFRTASDTEVILAAYDTWGLACVEQLEGMFAFALFDSATQTGLIACDPTGQKTVYLWEDDDALVFASEIDPLIKDPYRTKDWDLDGLAEFTAHRFILGSTTHIRQIRKLESGTWLTRTPERQETGRYYRIPRGDLTRTDVPAIRQEIRNAVVDGCRRTFDLEVPYGLLLSGGIDSTAVLAAARRAGLPMRTFSIGFQPTGQLLPRSTSVFDEFACSRALAREHATQHTEITLSDAAYCAYLDRWIETAGEPLGSQEAPCLIRLFEEAGRETRVIFSGSGPDEIFDGYSYGRAMADVPLPELAERYFATFHWSGKTDLRQLMPHHDAALLTTSKYRQILSLYGDWPLDSLQAVQLLHFHGRLVAYEFRQMDLISMRHSVEARSPLASTELVRAAFDFHGKLKQLDGSEKGIYKQALADLVPPAIASRKKQGFPIPAEMWFSRPFTERAAILFDQGCVLSSAGLVDPGYLRRLWEDPDPATRNLFSRLYTAEGILRRQAPYLAPSLAA